MVDEQKDISHEIDVLGKMLDRMKKNSSIEKLFIKDKQRLVYYKLWTISLKRPGTELTVKEFIKGTGLTKNDAHYWIERLSFLGGFDFVNRGSGAENFIRVFKPGAFNKKAIDYILNEEETE